MNDPMTTSFMAKYIFTRLRFAAIPIFIILIALLETQRFFPSFRLFTFGLAFLLLVDIASLSHGKWRDALLVFVSLVFGLTIIEAAANIMEPKISTVTTSGASVPRPIIGWGPQRAGRFHSEKTDTGTGATIYSVDYTIDANLLRETHSSPSGPTVAFFGDSMTFGQGVDDAETLPQAFADRFDRELRVLNFAFIGHGPSQFLRELETGIYDSLLGSQSQAFVFVTAAWHAERTACKASFVFHAPRYALEGDSVVYKSPCRDGARLKLQEWLGGSAAYRNFIAPLWSKLSPDDVALYVEILTRAATLAKEKYGVPTLLPYLRTPDDYLRGTGFTDDAIIQRLRDGGAIVLDASLEKEHAGGARISIEGDGHPTPLANRLRAELLERFFKTKGLGTLPSNMP